MFSKVIELIINAQSIVCNTHEKAYNSDFVFQYITLKVYKYDPIKHGANYIPLPKEISAQKCVINIKNENNNCFQYSVLLDLMLVQGVIMKHVKTVSYYKEKSKSMCKLIIKLNFANCPLQCQLTLLVSMRRHWNALLMFKYLV